MDTTTPITAHQRKLQNDRRAMSIYARRRDIDRYHEQRRLERELREVYDS